MVRSFTGMSLGSITSPHLVGWMYVPVLDGETEERRIVTLIAMSNAKARNLMTILRKALARGGH